MIPSAPAALRLQWVGQTRMAHLEAHMLAAMNNWLARWVSEGWSLRNCRGRFPGDRQFRVGGGTVWIVAQWAATPELRIQLPAAIVEAIFGLESGEGLITDDSKPGRPGLHDQVLDQVARNLATEVVGKPPASVRWLEPQRDGPSLPTFDVSFSLSIMIDGRCVAIGASLSPTLVEEICPPSTGVKYSPQIAAVMEGLKGVEGPRVTARMKGARMSLRQLSSLTKGDVIVLDQRLDEPVELVARGGGEPVALARIGRSESLRAVQVISVASQKG